MDRTERLKMLCAAFDIAQNLPISDQIRIYTEMLTFEEVKQFAKPEIDRIRDQLVIQRDYNMLEVLKEHLYNIGIEFNYSRPKPTLYTNNQNVHVLAKSTEKTALAIIKAYPSHYFRPVRFSLEIFDSFFKSIEEFEYHAFEPRKLFASVYECMITSKNSEAMLERLKEEIIESDGMCLTGCVVRLVNALRGFDVEFETKIDEYEHERSKSFYHLTKAIAELNIDTTNLIPEIGKLVNNKHVHISRKFGIRILEAYTGLTWTKQNGKYFVK